MAASLRNIFLLTLVAGFVDTATFIHLYGLFSSHVTGNFVVLAAAIGNGVRSNDLLKLLSFPVFIFAAVAATVIHDRVTGHDKEDGFDRWLTFLTGALLLAAGLSAFISSGHTSADSVSTVDTIAGMTAVFAMGMQNAIHRFAASLSPPTTVMTGTVTQLTVMATRKIFARPNSAGKPASKPFSTSGLFYLAAAFGAGCLLSVPITLLTGLGALVVPGAILAAIALVEGNLTPRAG